MQRHFQRRLMARARRDRHATRMQAAKMIFGMVNIEQFAHCLFVLFCVHIVYSDNLIVGKFFKIDCTL